MKSEANAKPGNIARLCPLEWHAEYAPLFEALRRMWPAMLPDARRVEFRNRRSGNIDYSALPSAVRGPQIGGISLFGINGFVIGL
jgi:hypothetical protein